MPNFRMFATSKVTVPAQTSDNAPAKVPRKRSKKETPPTEQTPPVPEADAPVKKPRSRSKKTEEAP